MCSLSLLVALAANLGTLWQWWSNPSETRCIKELRARGGGRRGGGAKWPSTWGETHFITWRQERKEGKREEEKWSWCSFYYEGPEQGAVPHRDGSPQEVPLTFTPRSTGGRAPLIMSKRSRFRRWAFTSLIALAHTHVLTSASTIHTSVEFGARRGPSSNSERERHHYSWAPLCSLSS